MANDSSAKTTGAQTIQTAQVLLIDDEVEHANVMADALRKPGHVCTVRHSAAEGLEELRGGQFDVIVTDLIMDGGPTGMRILEEARRLQPHAKTIMVTAHGDIPTAKEAMRSGAYDFIEKPLDLEVFRNLVNRAAEAVLLVHENQRLREQLDDQFSFENIICTSAAMKQVIRVLCQVAPTDLPILIIGETGTGKELVARALHHASDRHKERFKPVNCAAFTESLLESELFGHVRGAFTGADKATEGVFEYANGGTLFLDEIGDMPLPMQSKLLRVLESGEVVRVGSNDPRTVDVRFVSATHRDIHRMVDEGLFRRDLYFRIKGTEIRLPPLRERREDIPLLAASALADYAAKYHKTVTGISHEVMRRMIAYDWPGNVRQLLTTIGNLVVFCEEGGQLSLEHLPEEVRLGSTEADSDSSAARVSGSLAGIDLSELEKRAIRETLKLAQGNRERAAAMLGIGERTLYRKLKEYGLR